MGKKIIIRGADFSQNGFNFVEITTEYTDLKCYDRKTNAEYPIPAEKSWYTCALKPNYNKLSLDHTMAPNAASLGVNVEDYTHVKIEGYGDSITAWDNLSCPIIACIDNDNNVLGGIIASINNQSDTTLLNAGWTKVIRPENCVYRSTFEMDIPIGTTRIYTSMSIHEQQNFKMTLSKLVIN